MIIELINFTQADLNTGGIVVRTVTDQVVSGVAEKRPVLTRWISVNNESNNTINFVPLNTLEYEHYQREDDVTDLIPVVDGDSKTLEWMNDEITTILCSGVSGGGHDAGVDFVLYKK